MMVTKTKKYWVLLTLGLGLLAGVGLEAQMTLDKIIINPNQKVSGVLAAVTSQSPTNAEQVLAILGQAIADISSQKTFTDSLASLEVLMNWLTPRVSTSKSDDMLISRKPYFNRTNLMALFLTMETIKTFLKTKLLSDGAYLDGRFVSFGNVINAKAPVGATPQIDEPSIVEKGIFKKNAIKYTADFFGTRVSLTTATNARDVLAAVGKLYAGLSYSMSRTYVNFEGFSYSTNPDTINFVQSNTQGLLDSIQAFIIKLMANVSINENDSKWYKTTAYFDRGNFAVLVALLQAIEHFCVRKICTDKNKTIAIFNQFYNKFGVQITRSWQ